MRIGIVAPSTPIRQAEALAVRALAAQSHPQAELIFAPQCFATAGHFAGEDDERLRALVAMANREDVDAIWFASGGYGACRIAAAAAAAMENKARTKAFMGYSDQGNLLAALYRAGFANVAHGPMPGDIRRKGGDVAIVRALDWLTKRSHSALDQGLASGKCHVAFNLVTLSMLLGTALEPDLRGHILSIEEVSEHLYAFDRAFFHVAANLSAGAADKVSESGQKEKIAGIRLGRVSDVPQNDRPFGANAGEIARYWCDYFGIEWLGSADIGHDSDNHVIPFGLHRGA